MRRVIARWILVATLTLVGSSIVGAVVTAVFGPYVSYVSTFATTKTYVPPPPVMVPIAPQAFQTPRRPTPAEQPGFEWVIQRAIDAGTSRNQGSDLLNACDPDRMVEEWVRFGAYAARGIEPESEKASDREQIRLALWNFAEQDKDLLRPGRIEIVSLAPAVSGTDWLLLAKHTRLIHGVKVTQYVRWWLCEKYGAYRVYDFEVPGHRLRFNALVAGRSAVKFKGIPRVERAMTDAEREAAVTALTDAVLRATTDRRWTARAELPPCDHYEFLPPLEAVSQCVSRCADYRPARSDTLYAKSLALWPDSPPIHLIAATYAATPVVRLAYLAVYWNAAGNHPWAYAVETGEPQDDPEPDAKAAAILLRGWDETPGNKDLLNALGHRMPRNRLAELVKLIAAGPDPGPTFAAVAAVNYHVRNLTPDLLKLRPDEPDFRIAAAVTSLPKATPAAAKAALAEALRTAPAERTRFLIRYCVLAEQNGQIENAYAAAAANGEARAAYRYLTAASTIPHDLESDSRIPAAVAYRAMTAAHAAAFPNDPWLALVAAEIDLQHDRFAKADAKLAALSKVLPPVPAGAVLIPWKRTPQDNRNHEPEVLALPDEASLAFRERIRDMRTVCHYKLGLWDEARTNLAPMETTIQQIIDLMTKEKTAADLERAMGRDVPAGPDGSARLGALLSRCAPAMPDSVELLRWIGDHYFQAGLYAEAIAYYEHYGSHQAGTVTPHTVAANNHLARARHRTGHPVEAVTAARFAQDGSVEALLLLATVHMANKDTPSARLFLDLLAARSPEYHKAWCANDPDLGPLLKRPAFADLLKK